MTIIIVLKIKISAVRCKTVFFIKREVVLQQWSINTGYFVTHWVLHRDLCGHFFIRVRLWELLNIKTLSYQYKNSHCKNRRIWWPPHLYNGNPYTRKNGLDIGTGLRRNQYVVPLWWRYQMETFSALLALFAGNSPVTGEFPSQRPVARSFDVFFDLRLNKRLSKQSWGWWFETP